MLCARTTVVLTVTATLCETLSELDRHAEAGSLIRETRSRLLKSLGEEHPYALRAARILGQVLLKQGEAEDAAKVLRSTHATQLRLFGAEHAETQLTATAVERLLL